MLYASHCLIITPCSFFFVCVYLPFDIAACLGHLEFQEARDELEGVIDLQDRDMLAVVSDFNVEFSHTDRCHTND